MVLSFDTLRKNLDGQTALFLIELPFQIIKEDILLAKRLFLQLIKLQFSM